MVTMTNKDRLEKKSADYLAMKEKWIKAADISAGESAVIKAGETYLPRFPDETTKEYNYRKSLAKFTNVYRDTLENLANKPFEQEIELSQGTETAPKTHPAEIEAFIEDVDGSNSNITVFASEYFYRGINFAIDFIMVDYPNRPTDRVRSVAEEKALGLRPYWSYVSAFNVFEIKSAMVNGKERFTYVRIFEPKNGDKPDGFRELFYDPNTGIASFQLWKWDGKSDYIQDGGLGIITIGFIPLVPFMTGRRKGKSWQFEPPMQDSADLQIKLYRAESNLEYVKTVAAFPMLVGMGVTPKRAGGDDKGDILRMLTGPSVVLYAPFSPATGAAGDWKYLEPSGSSLTFLRDDIKELKQDLRELGRQPLTVSSGNLTVITTAVAAGKAKTAVKKWGINLTDALSIALYYTALWLGITNYEPSLQVFDGYDDLPDGDNGAGVVVGLNGSGKLSDKTMYQELQRRGTLSSEFDYEQEMQRISEQKPTPDPNNPDGVI